MPGPLYQYVAEDHERLDSLFQRAVAQPDMIDVESYHEFRKGLLRHISIEEKSYCLPSLGGRAAGRLP